MQKDTNLGFPILTFQWFFQKTNRCSQAVVTSLFYPFSQLFSILIIVGCFWALSSTNLYGQDTQILKVSVKEAQSYAIKNNLNAVNARLRVDSSRQVVKEITAVGLPQVEAKVNYQHYLKLPTSLVPGEAFGMPEQDFVELTFGTKNNLTAGIDVTQLIFDGTYFLGVRASHLFIERAEKQARATETDIKDKVTRAYYTVLVAKENMNILEQNTKVLDRVLYETTQLYENGFVEKLEVNRLKLSLANLKTRISSAERQYILAKDNLKFQMGLDLSKDIELSDSLDGLTARTDPAYLANLELLKNEATNRRVEMQLLNTGSAFRELDIRQVKSQYLPKLYGFGSLQANFQNDNFRIFSNKWFPTSFLGLELQVPIFDGFRKKRQIAQREIDLKKINNTKELFKESISLQIINAQTSYKNALEQIQHQQETIELAQDLYDVTLFKYKEGLGSSLEVTNAESTLYETQGLYIKALYDLLIAQADLDKALGSY